MANPTTNYGWVMPTSASLVTDLPADFNVFGQAVDTSMQYLLGGTTGQVLSKISATNMAFTWTTPTDQTPLTTKGDLFTFTTVDARLAVGTNKYVLGADSAQATGLAWQTSPQSVMTTTGDILYASGANTPARLGIGSSAQVLTVASGVPSWSTPAAASSGLVLISRQTFSNVATTTTTFDSVFSTTYKSYFISVESAFSTTGVSGDDFYMQLRYAGPTTQATTYIWTNSTYTMATGANALTSANGVSQWQISGDMNTSAERFAGMYNLYLRESATPRVEIAGRGLSGSSGKAVDVFGYVYTDRDYTGFILSSSSSNISGTVAVYGLATV